ncbi:hypothetical protein [Paramaledivibacter caminithermalis]|jgi:hypothetical protein|uniref:Uncharacterized protein n=1 Tax=Paramaledivibacter caminithermalis (strain DSM 15212 / CIP 107654 / DViRD3) TaxID=1121301 RepID=A0A1M6S5Y1_PARC5|nr:hypothetical protein [Paramaledivibacter caminithermalis]SHK40192.1 hypothetical protein SAMN02745912_03196 [Paramaledivibacter caminithermalis DSM 15212]
MRIIGIFEKENQIGGLVDSLRNVGIDRNDLVISDKPKTNSRNSALDKVYIKSEADSLSSLSTLSNDLPKEADKGILVSVEIPKNKASHIREIMEQSGAAKIIFD